MSLKCVFAHHLCVLVSGKKMENTFIYISQPPDDYNILERLSIYNNIYIKTWQLHVKGSNIHLRKKLRDDTNDQEFCCFREYIRTI